jgi:hypothetical protein
MMLPRGLEAMPSLPRKWTVCLSSAGMSFSTIVSAPAALMALTEAIEAARASLGAAVYFAENVFVTPANQQPN